MVATDSVEQHLSVGALVMVEYVTYPVRRHYARCAVRGWRNEAYILLEPQGGTKPLPLHQNDPCAVRFLHEGKVCGFMSTVAEPQRPSVPHFSVAWPDQIQTKRLRVHERVNTAIPCAVQSAKGPAETCEIRNISLGGCAIKTARKLDRDTEVQLDFILMNSFPIALKATVRSVTREGDSFNVGLAFIEADARARDDLNFFVCTRVESAREAAGQSPRVVVYESEAESSQRIREHLTGEDIEVATAACLVDAFYLLRLRPPHAFVIGNVNPGLDAGDVGRIVQATRGCETLPVMLIGEEQPATDGKPAVKSILYPELMRLTAEIKEAFGAQAHGEPPL